MTKHPVNSLLTKRRLLLIALLAVLPWIGAASGPEVSASEPQNQLTEQENVAKSPGQWNHLRIRVNGAHAG